MSRKRIIAAAVAAAAFALSACSTTTDPEPTGDGETTTAVELPTVALSNAFIGNDWRKSMITAFEEAAQGAVDDGLIASFQVSNAPGDNSATEQIAQLKSLLLDEPDILLINPASPTALSPTIQEACDAGTIVVVFDSGIESDCAYVVTNSFPEWGTVATENIAQAMGGEGNLLISRGVVGSDPEQQYYDAQLAVLENYPDIEVVAEITGFCSSEKAQAAALAVLPSLPQIDGVAGCGDGFGIASAFETAGRDVPAVTFEPSGNALEYWATNGAGAGSIAIMSDPGQSVAALFTGLWIYNGNDIDTTTVFPAVLITEDARNEWAAVVGSNEIASWQWTKELVEAQIRAQANGNNAPLPPVPSN